MALCGALVGCLQLFGLFISFLLSRTSTTRAMLTHRQVSVNPLAGSVDNVFARLCGFPIVLILDFCRFAAQRLRMIERQGKLLRTKRRFSLRRELKDPACIPAGGDASPLRHGARPIGSTGEIAFSHSVDGFEVQPCKERFHSASPITLVTLSANRSTLREGFSHAFPVVLPILFMLGAGCWELWGSPIATPILHPSLFSSFARRSMFPAPEESSA